MAKVNIMIKVFVIFSVLVLFSGCAADKVALRYVWPPLPDEPKIEFLGVYKSRTDLLQNNLLSKIVGTEDDTFALANPQGIAADGQGKVYVTDMKLGGVMVFDFNAKTTSILGGDAAGGLFNKPSGIAFDGEGNIYVADTEKRTISAFTKNGMPLSSMDLSNQLKSIGFIAIDKERKRVVVPDPVSHKVHIIDFSGKIITTIDKYEGEEGVFNRPNAVAVDSQGDILVADMFNSRVERFSPEGKFISMFGTLGENPGQLALSTAVAVDSEGHIYVTDAKSNRFNVFDRNGDFLLAIGTLGDAKQKIGTFETPASIFIDKNDTIYIVERFSKRFQKFQYLNAAYLAKNPLKKETLAKPFQPKIEKNNK